MLRMYGFLPKTRALGPHERFALWTQGCGRSCAGCMTPAARSMDGGFSMAVSALAERILAAEEIEGITITGGEPFLQAKGLVKLIREVRNRRDLGVIVYSGFPLPELREKKERESAVRNFLGSIDLLIDGPYLAERDDGRSLRGSDNQDVHPLTDRYAGIVSEWYGRSRRAAELHLVGEELFLAGIPGRDILRKWREKELTKMGRERGGRF
ncbi:MAG: 4Fe-4S single cluster domain-containing protein [Desulfococcaceae bacterium]